MGTGESKELIKYLANTKLQSTFKAQVGGLAPRLRTISKLMQTRENRKADRDFFYVDWGGWDHHANMKYEMNNRLPEVNDGLQGFVNQIKADGLWDNVTIVVLSEFARTITPNNNAGSDHAWGGNYFMMGGSVKGGRIVGEFPNDFTKDSPLNGSGNTRVRFIPTTSWDSVWHGVIQWLGVEEDDDLKYCLPNKDNTAPNPIVGQRQFPLLLKGDLFEDPNSEAPTSSPSSLTANVNGTATVTEPCLEGEVMCN
jgi:uncharacterized protein (DUF1501 family)